MSPFAQFKQRWSAGCGSELCAKAHHVVLCRGTVPADIVMVGEAPGKSEDVIGLPFIGQAGHLFQERIIDRCIPKGIDYALANLTGCIPRDEFGNKADNPELKDIKKCSLRLKEFLELCQPKLLVSVGELSKKWLPEVSSNPKRCHLTHPAAILRANISQRGLMIQRCIVTLSQAVAELENKV